MPSHVDLQHIVMVGPRFLLSTAHYWVGSPVGTVVLHTLIRVITN